MPENPLSERDPSQPMSAEEAVTELTILLETSVETILTEIPELDDFTGRVFIKHVLPNSISYMIHGYSENGLTFSYTIYPPFGGNDYCKAHGFQITENQLRSLPPFLQDLK